MRRAPARLRQESRSRKSSECSVLAARGRARTTTSLPSRTSLSRHACRSRRVTRLRTTATPTDRLTTNPSLGSPLVASACTTTVGEPARRPRRVMAAKSRDRVSRDDKGSTKRVRERRARSGSEARATLASTVGEDGPSRSCAHPKPEAVSLVPATVVRLKRALAHEGGSTVGTTTGLSPCFRSPPERPRQVVSSGRYRSGGGPSHDTGGRQRGQT
jgi:hypothetical protein